MAPCSLYHLHVSLGVLLVRYSTLASLLRETCCYTASHLPLGVTNEESFHSVSSACHPVEFLSTSLPDFLSIPIYHAFHNVYPWGRDEPSPQYFTPTWVASLWDRKQHGPHVSDLY